MSRKFKFSSTVADYMKRFGKGEIHAEEKADVKPDAAEAAVTEKKAVQEAHEASGKNAPAVETEGVLVYALTDVGKVRSANQDALIVGEKVFGVADGMGGHKGGETASAGARDGLIELLKDKTPALDTLREAVSEVNTRLFNQQKTDDKLTGMGTTLTALWLSEHYVYVGHVGDSRAYRLRDGKLQQMTSDHSLVAELVRSGVLTEQQAAGHPMRNVITRAVGTEETVDVDLMVEERAKGDIWLVCSDGLYGLVSDSAMEAILSVNTLEAAAKLLIEAALAAGGHDNVSVMLLQDKEGSR